MPNQLQLLAKIESIEPDSGKFTGVFAIEELDRHGETMDYEKSKPYFAEWSSRHATASGGKAAGSLRVMHQKTVIGTLSKVFFNDAEKKIIVEGEVIDPVHRALLKKGAYTGLSAGGMKKVFNGPNGDRRYVAMPSECSLVDTPAAPGAIIMLKYADGHEEALDVEGLQKEGEEELLKSLGAIETMAGALRSLGWVMPDTEENRDKLLQIRKKAHKLLLDLVKETFSELEAENEAEIYEHSYDPKGDTQMPEPVIPDNTESIEKLQKDFDGKLGAFTGKVEELSKANDAKFAELTSHIENLSKAMDSIVKGFETLTTKPTGADTAVRTMTKSADSSYENPDKKEEVPPVIKKMEKIHDEDAAVEAMRGLKPLNSKTN